MKLVLVFFCFLMVLSCKNRVSSTLNASPAVVDFTIKKCDVPDLGEASVANEHKETQMLWGAWEYDAVVHDRIGGKSESDWLPIDKIHQFDRDDAVAKSFVFDTKEIEDYKFCYYSAGKYSRYDGKKLLKTEPILVVNFLGNTAMLRQDDPNDVSRVEIHFFSGVFGFPLGQPGVNDLLFLGGDKLRHDEYTAMKRKK